ncbi:MAG: molybdopterin-dependent oxidoreductase [Acidobacteria bacterium]|nr:molybdopterin-dependent oxidoreductase [Acidobacteriota bacterium]
MSHRETHVTTCVLDCPDGCALEVEVIDDRVASIGPAVEAGTSFICGKVANFHQRLYHEERVLHPLRRTGPKGSGHFEVISWQQALEEIAERLLAVRQEFGGEAILPYHYGGSNGLLTDDLLDDLFFARLGASRLAKTICAVPATEVAVGMYGKMPGVAFEDYARAQCIVVWGANPRGSNIHLVPFLREARGRGAFVASIDPRENFGPGEVDLHLPVLPGQDLPVALGMINRWRTQGVLDEAFLREHARGLDPLLERAAEWTLERAAAVAGVPWRDIAHIADRLAESSPAVVRCGWGLERNKNGAQAIAAVLAIPALLGKFGVRGGGYTLSNNGGTRFDRDAVTGPLEWSTRRLNMTQLGRQIDPDAEEPLDPPVKMLFVYNSNPLVSTPDQNAIERGLARDDLFTVVHEQVMTDTARWADLVLPATTFLEGTDLRVSYGDYVAGGIRPVIEPVGEARTNMQLFGALARQLGMIDTAFSWSDEELLRRAVGALRLAGAPAESTLAAGSRQDYDFAGATPVQLETVRPLTADGKIQLTPTQLGPAPYAWLEPAADFPLALVTPGSDRLINSTLGESNVDTLTVTLHPDDAARRGLASGSPVRVYNRQGEVHCQARVSDKVRPGVVAMPKGAWRRSSLNGATSTALCPDTTQVVGGAACFNDARVEVEELTA